MSCEHQMFVITHLTGININKAKQNILLPYFVSLDAENLYNITLIVDCGYLKIQLTNSHSFLVQNTLNGSYRNLVCILYT